MLSPSPVHVLLGRVLVRGGRVLMCLLRMLVGCLGVLLRFLVLAALVMVNRFQAVVCRRLMVRHRVQVMRFRGVCDLRSAGHEAVPFRATCAIVQQSLSLPRSRVYRIRDAFRKARPVGGVGQESMAPAMGCGVVRAARPQHVARARAVHPREIVRADTTWSPQVPRRWCR